MPVTKDFSVWFGIFSEWLYERDIVSRLGNLESDIRLDFGRTEGPAFQSLRDGQILRSYPILTGARKELVQYILDWFDHPGNLDRCTYPSLTRVVFVWNDLPLLVLENTRVLTTGTTADKQVSLLIDLCRLASKTYILPRSNQDIVYEKRWKTIGAFLIFVGFSSLFHSNGTGAS